VELDPTYLTNVLRGSQNEAGDEEKEDNANEKKSNNIAVHRARIRRFAIHLSVCDVDSGSKGGGGGGGASSTARKATSAFLHSVFGTNDVSDDGDDGGDGYGTGMALVAHVELEGLDIVLAPGRTNPVMEWSTPSQQQSAQQQLQHQEQQSPNTPSQEQDASSAPGFFSSLVDAAMKSLRLSIDISDVTIRAHSSPYCNVVDGLNDDDAIYDDRNGVGGYDGDNGCWVALRLASARCYDLIEESPNSTPSGKTRLDGDKDRSKVKTAPKTREKLILSKALDWEGITIETGGSGIPMGRISTATSSSYTSIFQSTGGGHLRFRVFETWSTNTSQQKGSFLSARRDIEVSLGQRMGIDVDLCSLTRLVDIANALTQCDEEDGDFVDAYDDEEEDNSRSWEDASDLIEQQNGTTKKTSSSVVVDSNKNPTTLADEFSKETYDQIMKQYTDARHLARTRELRGGLLIPSFEERDDVDEDNMGGGEISFDAFFDANDHSVSYYCSMMEEKPSVGEYEEGQKKGTNSRSVGQTKIDVGLPELTVKLHVGMPSARADGILHRTSMEQEDHSSEEYILLSLGDLRVIVFGSVGESKVNCSVSHFDIESQVTDMQGDIVNAPLLRFLDDDSDGVMGSELLVSIAPCISMMAELSGSEDETQTRRVDLVLQPLEIIYQEQALRRLSDVIALLPSFETASSDAEGEDSNLMNAYFSVSSSSIVLMIPCQCNSEKILKDTTPNPLFQRHGYRDQESGGRKFSGLGVELDNITIDLSRKVSIIDNDQTNSEEKAAMSCSHVILFAKGTELERGRRYRKFSSYISRRADIVALTGDEDSEPDASITISFSTAVQQTSRSFPIILPLSSTKARQEMDESDGEIDHLYEDEFKSANGLSGIQSSDPQYILSSEANEAKRELAINIPNIFFESTTLERQQLSDLLTNIRPGDNEPESVNHRPTDANSTHLGKANLLGLAVNVGQISVVLHSSELNESNSYSLIMDKMQIHTLVSSSGVRNVRFLSHDITLYELSNFCPAPDMCVRNQYPTSCIERCKRIQERLTKSPSTIARAIFFRQKLCQSLSADTPAVMVDALIRGDDECREMGIHINVYDMTYRYIMNSDWIRNLTALVKGKSSEGEVGKQYSAQEEQEEVVQEEVSLETSSSLTNLFVTLADCNVDYTSPQNFRNASRVIFRMGEVRFTSNIVTPSAAVQAYKLSLSDLRLHICNYRHCHNEENSLLSCAHRHLYKDDLFLPGEARCFVGRNVVGLDDVLCRMNFVNVAILDKLDTIIFKNNCGIDGHQGHQQNDPATTVVCTVGKLSIYACHDSFSCLNETYNEWFIKSTALSEEEIEKLRESSESQSDVGVVKEAHFPENECLLPLEQKSQSVSCSKGATKAVAKSMENPEAFHVSRTKSQASSQQHQYRDDNVSLDLTKSLLFQNYYTFDAKTNNQAVIDQRQNTDDRFVMRRVEHDITLQKSSSSDEEWATVEHEFLKHSTLPREKDQSAGWVLCDSHKQAPASRKAQTVKVFPQHIPVKPPLDPFGGGTLDTAKLAGTNAAPDIATRVIVKDGSVTLRFFDGFDWVTDAPQFHQSKESKKDRKKQLLSSLIDGDGPSSPLNIMPLPEDRNKNLQRDLARRKLRRNAHRYFQISICGLKLKQDAFAESKDHLLASCLDLSMSDFFIAETISNGDPLKLMGEWINESEHPRDDSDGVIMLKMITMHPELRVSSDGKVMSDETRATLELLPLRFYLNQNALRFIRSFFAGPSKPEEDDPHDVDDENDFISDDEIINIFFESFKVRPCKLKVDYQPENMDIDSFRDGNYVEILNLCPLEDMILTLQPVEMQDLTGWGPVFSELAGRWIEDICATQAHKFFTRASPFQPFSNLGDPIADLAMVLVVPEGSVTDYFKGIVGGTTVFAGRVALEALSTSAKLTRFAANQLNSKALSPAGLKSSLPRRPRNVPRHAGDAAGHAYESVARGLREANYKIVTVPLREYQQSGAGGAARSALKGIPIGVIAPIAGASEALSYTLLGLRNQLKPEIRKEEEASLRGLQYD